MESHQGENEGVGALDMNTRKYWGEKADNQRSEDDIEEEDENEQDSVEIPRGVSVTTTKTFSTSQLRKELFEEIHQCEIEIRPITELVERWTKWMGRWPHRGLNRMRPTVYAQGIPQCIRSPVWRMLSGTFQQEEITPEYYSTLLEGEENSDMKILCLDLDRTWVGHHYFCREDRIAQQQLYNVIKAFVNRYPEIGYCQGMCFVVGLLLIYMLPWEAFSVFCWMVENHLKVYYEKGMVGLFEDTNRLQILLSIFLPRLSKHFESNGIDLMNFTSNWFASIFSSLNSWATMLHIYDLFFIEGRNALLVSALCILHLCEDELLQRKGIDQLLPFLLNIPEGVLPPDKFHLSLSSLPLESLFREDLDKLEALASYPSSRIYSYTFFHPQLSHLKVSPRRYNEYSNPNLNTCGSPPSYRFSLSFRTVSDPRGSPVAPRRSYQPPSTIKEKSNVRFFDKFNLSMGFSRMSLFPSKFSSSEPNLPPHNRASMCGGSVTRDDILSYEEQRKNRASST